jgi:signal transduction histidine kinase
MMALFDHERIVQVLVNLLSNALKYSPSSSQVQVAAVVEGEFVRVTVADKGPGIPDAAKQTIFDRFKQVSRDDERIHKGSGLGLAICRSIIECHFGRIGVESTVGNGSTFWFTLPASERVSAAVDSHS